MLLPKIMEMDNGDEHRFEIETDNGDEHRFEIETIS
jgi:hypothetical protein